MQNDWFMEQIEMMTRFLGKVLFHKDLAPEEFQLVDAQSFSEGDLTAITVKRLLSQNRINEAENLIFDEIEKEAIQSAKQTDMDIPKCKNCTLDCTLEEIAVLNYLKEKPNATQKEIAQHIGKSERTVKSMTVNLSERGIIERKNGRRNGFWEIKK